MSYSSIDQLTNSADFAGRVRACTVEQAHVYKDDARPDFVALADAALKGEGYVYLAFTRLTAAAPDIADMAGDPADQAAVPDEDVLASVQANWQIVAALYFDEEGIPNL